MPDFGYTICADGTIELTVCGITLTGISPYVDERPVLPLSVTSGDGFIRYSCEDGAITLSISENDQELILSTVVEGFGHVHDIDPIGSAVISADHAYVQGFGMEGPSGYHEIGSCFRKSHGIIGLTGDTGSAVMFAVDHRRYSLAFCVSERETMYGSLRTLSAGFNLEGTAEGTIRLPDIHLTGGTEITVCMTAAAEKIASEMGARTSAAPGFHWCSWYYHYENLSHEILEGFLNDLGKDRVDFNYIQIDAGYTDHVGDWLTFNHRYPYGLGGAAEKILRSGYAAGIWIAPFMVGDKSAVYRDHPDWVLHEKDGKPFVRFRSYTEPKIWGNTDNDYYVLDMTHPDAAAYLRTVFETFRGYGYTLYKTDFLLWGMIDSSRVIRYDNTRTSVMIMRDTMAMIRDAIGEDSYLLGSIAPFMPCIGYVDGMRIASDMGAQWTDGAFGPANLLQELPYDNYFNNIFWQNDPDSVILRHFATHLTDAETRSIALLQALSGGIITTSDPVTQLTEDRRSLLDLIRPAARVTAQLPLLTEGCEEIVITHELPDWDLLYVLNPTDHPLRIDLRIDELFGSKAEFQYRFDWNDENRIVSEKCSCFSDILAPHDSALLFITEEPLTAKPSNLWGRSKRYF